MNVIRNLENWEDYSFGSNYSEKFSNLPARQRWNNTLYNLLWTKNLLFRIWLLPMHTVTRFCRLYNWKHLLFLEIIKVYKFLQIFQTCVESKIAVKSKIIQSTIQRISVNRLVCKLEGTHHRSRNSALRKAFSIQRRRKFWKIFRREKIPCEYACVVKHTHTHRFPNAFRMLSSLSPRSESFARARHGFRSRVNLLPVSGEKLHGGVSRLITQKSTAFMGKEAEPSVELCCADESAFLHRRKMSRRERERERERERKRENRAPTKSKNPRTNYRKIRLNVSDRDHRGLTCWPLLAKLLRKSTTFWAGYWNVAECQSSSVAATRRGTAILWTIWFLTFNLLNSRFSRKYSNICE